MPQNEKFVKPRKEPKAPKPYTPIQFINISLNDPQKAEAMSYLDWDGLTTYGLVDEIVMRGYKLTVTVDQDNRCYIVSTTGTENTINPFKCITSRHDDLDACLRYALYKIVVVFGDDIWTEQPRPSNFG